MALNAYKHKTKTNSIRVDVNLHFDGNRVIGRTGVSCDGVGNHEWEPQHQEHQKNHAPSHERLPEFTVLDSTAFV